MSGSQESSPLEQEPSNKVEWSSSIAEVYDLSDIPSEIGRGEVILYDRSDFHTPIERVQVTAKRLDDGGEECTELTAVIQLDRSRDDYDAKPSTGSLQTRRGILHKFIGGYNVYGMRESSKFVPSGCTDRDLRIESTVFNNVFIIYHTSGSKVLVWVDAKKKRITVSNNLTLNGSSGNSNTRVEVHAPANGTTDFTDTLEGFLKGFMRTVSFTAGLLQHDPENYRYKRTYQVGKERKAVERKNTANVGTTALKGSQTEQRSKPLGPEGIPGAEKVESGLSLDDVGGLEEVKKTLRDISISFQHPEVMEKWGAKRPQGVLLYGAPGTGKTMLTRALAGEIGAEMWALQSTDIYEKWLGDSEQHIKDIFERAKAHQGRLILFFDEFDAIVGITESPSSGGADNARNSVGGIFKQEMNDLAAINPNVLVVAATNNLDRIEPALIRSGRFDHKVYVPMPDQEARQQITAKIAARTISQHETSEFRIYGDDFDATQLAVETDGMSGADIAEIFRRLALARAMQEARSGEAQPPISQEEIVTEIKKFKLSS